eukprot:480671-Prorocentrum_minimum.AAC.5
MSDTTGLFLSKGLKQGPYRQIRALRVRSGSLGCRAHPRRYRHRRTRETKSHYYLIVFVSYLDVGHGGALLVEGRAGPDDAVELDIPRRDHLKGASGGHSE